MSEFPLISTPSGCRPENEAQSGSDLPKITQLGPREVLTGILCDVLLLVLPPSLSVCIRHMRHQPTGVVCIIAYTPDEFPRKLFLAQSPLCSLGDWADLERHSSFPGHRTGRKKEV